MIKLERNLTPACLSPAEEIRLAKVYQATNKSVWGKKDISDALSATSFGKCAYCEAKLSIESHYLEVDHFEHKDGYPHKVATWTNLLPSCRRCNGTKQGHDVISEPIVNPYLDPPTSHFWMSAYRYRAKTPLGQNSIDVLDLNNSERAVRARFAIGERIHETLLSCVERLEKYQDNRIAVRRNKLISLFSALLVECQPTAAYAATTATVLHSSEEYAKLATRLKDEDLWSEKLEEMHQTSLNLILIPS